MQSIQSANVRQVHIDMTPMVDLGFLLITFFIFTTALSDPTTMSLAMPKEGVPIDLAESKALNFVLDGENKVFSWEGSWSAGKVIPSSYDEREGMGKIIRDKQNALYQKEGTQGKDELMLLIKPTEKASYKNLIDALDEAVINGVKKYAVLKPSSEEQHPDY